MVTSSPLSFAGATQRVAAWGANLHGAAKAAYWSIAWVAVAMWWAVIAGYYLLYLLLPLLLIVLIPFRMMRRGSRRDKQLHEAIKRSRG